MLCHKQQRKVITMRACAIAPNDRRDQVKRIGEDLVRHYGKKRYYSVQEVKDANRRCNISADFGCWSLPPSTRMQNLTRIINR